MRIKIPTPGGFEDKATLEVLIDKVAIEGSPSVAPAVYKKDLLAMRSKHGHALVMDHDFYAHKLESQDVKISGKGDYTLKFNVRFWFKLCACMSALVDQRAHSRGKYFFVGVFAGESTFDSEELVQLL